MLRLKGDIRHSHASNAVLAERGNGAAATLLPARTCMTEMWLKVTFRSAAPTAPSPALSSRPW